MTYPTSRKPPHWFSSRSTTLAVLALAILSSPSLARAASSAHDKTALYQERLADAVTDAVGALTPELGEVPAESFEVKLVDPETGKKTNYTAPNPWPAVMPDMFAFLESEVDDDVYFVDVLEEAIRAHMTTLGEIAWELESRGNFEHGDTLAAFDPSKSGSIRVPAFGDFQDIHVHFRAMVEYDSGNAPGILVVFRFASERGSQPLLCRLVIPQDGLRPAFRRQVVVPRSGGPDALSRSYGDLPRLVKTRSVLEAWVAGQWVRPPNGWQQYLVDVPNHPFSSGEASGRQLMQRTRMVDPADLP